MLQLVYISSSREAVSAAELQRILAASRRNNGRDGITGLLFFDGKRFLQALEGEADKVVAAFERIRDDARHSGVVVLSRREIAEREFGDWAMASRGAPHEEDAMLARVAELAANAAPAVQATFNSFAQVRRRAA
ncbi:BLUF domain-containing protein [Sphingomonas lenta]|uniref:Activator of photopigment and puc with BLUF domain protein n=1 Tax=Sphingomonas lenta TaxID=1141887 RepID=A0A2A2SBR6_9SPHN|nr:BLUF domain-containing protein [Sphingomonas lenta]PAX06689.1 activator of photopigment and puc with BLUF domain protein [Sphingomonas lenta]